MPNRNSTAQDCHTFMSPGSGQAEHTERGAATTPRGGRKGHLYKQPTCLFCFVYKCHFLMISFIIWLKPWTPPPPPPPPMTSVCCSQARHFCPSCVQLLVCGMCIFRLCCVQFLVCVMCGALVCLVPSFRYTTARLREPSLASVASARSARRISLRLLQRVCPDPPPSPPVKPS